MKPSQLSSLINERLKAKGWKRSDLAKALQKRVATQTVYNAVAGRPVSSENLLLIFAALDLIVIEKPAKEGK